MGRPLWSSYGNSPVISRIHKLNDTILSRIFSYCIIEPDVDVWLNYTNTDPDGLARPSIYRAPVKLTRVCRRWRTLTLSTPALWTKLSLGASPVVGTERRVISPQRDARALQVFAERAQDLPLSIGFDYKSSINRPIENIEALANFDILLNAVTSLSNRIEALRMSIPIIFLPWAMGALRSARTFSLLRSLHVISHDHAPSPVLIDLAWCPNMEILKLEGVGLCPYYSTMDIRSKLTDLYLWRCGPTAEVLESLSKPGIQPNFLSVSYGPINPNVSRTTSAFPSLTSILRLEVEDMYSGAEAAQFFDHVDLPFLKELSVKSSRLPSGSWKPLVRMLAYSDPPLRKLLIRGTSLTDMDFVECLDKLPMLEDLAVDGRLFTSYTLQALHASTTGVREGSTLCPYLTDITLYHCFSCTALEVAEMVHTRFRVMHNYPYPDAEDQMATPELIRLVDCSQELQSLMTSSLIRQWIEAKSLQVKVVNSTARVPG